MDKRIALLGSSHAWELARCRVRRRLQCEDLVWCGVGTGLWLMCRKFWTSADRPHRRCHFGAQERWRGLIGYARNAGSGPTGWFRKLVPRSGTKMEPRFDAMRYLLPCESTATTQLSSNPLSHLWIPAALPLPAHRQNFLLFVITIMNSRLWAHVPFKTCNLSVLVPVYSISPFVSSLDLWILTVISGLSSSASFVFKRKRG